MTPEEAIRILDPETSAAALYGLGHDEAVALVEDACRLAVAALEAKQEPERNEPLTLDDLKEMDGQPVWAEEPDGYKSYSRWVLVDTAWKAKGLVYLYSWPGADTFQAFTARGGKIYRRPPAEG